MGPVHRGLHCRWGWMVGLDGCGMVVWVALWMVVGWLFGWLDNWSDSWLDPTSRGCGCKPLLARLHSAPLGPAGPVLPTTTHPPIQPTRPTARRVRPDAEWSYDGVSITPHETGVVLSLERIALLAPAACLPLLAPTACLACNSGGHSGQQRRQD